MRIVSLVPHATELLFALELDDEVVGVTHECDYPWAATELPKVTKDRLPEGGSAGEIDAAVREKTLAGESIYQLDEDAIRDLEPDLIVTQELCTVCAVSHDDVVAFAQTLDKVPEVITLDPHTLGEALGDIRTVAGQTDRKDEGVDLVEELAGRIDRVRLASRGMERPKVLAIEWLDPLFIGGHWVPQMIDYAGGEDVLGMPGEPSEVFDWDVAKASEPDIVLIMPCGRTALEAREEALEHFGKLEQLGASRIIAVEANAYFSRPGPRLVDGLELLSALLHPTSGIEAPDGSWYEVR
ncbi:MAG: ABC transporter substrate-binding protein [Solirubrobacteraceae bacterium]|nr:ABC transporter substrate-binding protein [Solirubrobacteraceae bacterium]